MEVFMFLFMSLLSWAYFAHHPMIFSFILISVSMVLGMAIHVHLSMWIFYSIALVFLGGMMVIFLYVAMLSNEDKIYYSGPSLMVYLIFLGLTLLFMNTGEGIVSAWYGNSELSMLSNIYKFYTISSLSLMIFYLLLTLFTTMKFTEGFKGTMMKMA